MRRSALAVALAVLAVAGCGSAGNSGGGSAKGGFVLAADRICAAHLRTVMEWLSQPRAGAPWHQQAVEDGGIFQIMSTTISRLESLGRAPGPSAGAFDGYVATMKARASLYMLMRIAEDRQDGVVALGFQRRIYQIDGLGDRRAHQYGLRICGTGLPDFGKALAAAGWTPR
jgi:hypothetical protein